MQIGIAALGIIFIISGVLNIVRPQRSYEPEKDETGENAPSPEFLRKTRRMGIVWCLLGALCAAYFIKLTFGG